MVQLHGEALQLVLQRLTVATDIVRCSISKAWAEASKHIQISALELEHCNFVPGPTALEQETKDAQAQLRWLQRLHQAEQLEALQEITL